MTKRPLILFSGGYDSTYLLQETLKEGDCDILSVKCGQSQLKNIQEELARKEILSVIEQCDFRGRVRGIYDFEVPLLKDASFSQAAPWMVGALWELDTKFHNEVRIGYVLGDQISAFLEDLKIAWKHLLKFSKWGYEIPLTFPLYSVSKKDVYTRLDPRLAKHVWFCEIPEVFDGKVRRCGQCGPCVTHENTLHALSKGPWLDEAWSGTVPQYTPSVYDLKKERDKEKGSIKQNSLLIEPLDVPKEEVFTDDPVDGIACEY